MDILTKETRGNDVDFSISEITSKKYVETTWKFVEIWSSTYRCNIHIESTWCWVITKDSGFYDLLECDDVVMADRGFQIQEDLLLHFCNLQVPPDAQQRVRKEIENL